MQHYFVKTIVIIFSLALNGITCMAQYSRQDTLRGSITPHRAWWDVLRYDIQVKPDYNTKTIIGSTSIRFRVLKDEQIMQIDLQQPMQIDSFILLSHMGKKNSAWRPGNM